MINTICVKIQQRQRRGKGNKITRDTGRKKEPIGERGVMEQIIREISDLGRTKLGKNYVLV